MTGIDVHIERVAVAKGLWASTAPVAQTVLLPRVAALLEQTIPEGVAGKKVLLKPNFVKPGDPMAVTSPAVLLAAAKALVDMGAKVTVADSPAFGSAERVAGSLGLIAPMRRLGVECETLSDPVRTEIETSCQGSFVVGISRKALETDLIVNLPRLKAHCQMMVTCGVKNLFGTVVGFRKALCHTRFGREMERFSAMIVGLGSHLPDRVTLLDAICAMDTTGPSGGRPFYMNILASSRSEVALDTAIYTVLGASVRQIPLWRAALEEGVAGATPEEIVFTGLSPHQITEGRQFRLPEELSPLIFSPIRFVKGRLKSLLKRLPLS